MKRGIFSFLNQKGQSIVEFGAILALFLPLIFVSIDFAKLGYSWAGQRVLLEYGLRQYLITSTDATVSSGILTKAAALRLNVGLTISITKPTSVSGRTIIYGSKKIQLSRNVVLNKVSSLFFPKNQTVTITVSGYTGGARSL